MKATPVCLAAWLLCAWSLANAADPQGPTHNLVSLQADASAEVANDTLVAVLSARAEGSQAARLADEVNRRINWAIAQAKAAAGITVETHSYQTSPVYVKNTLTGWRVSQAIRLESQNAARMSELVAKLQEQLQVRSIEFQVSEPAKRRVQNDLITQAIDRFTARAKLITGNLSRSSYRLVRLDVHTDHAAPPPRPMLRAMARSAEAVAAPALEAGTQRITVSVNGTVEVTED